MKVILESFDHLTKSLDPNLVRAGRGIAYFGAGLLAGILVKKYLRLFILSGIICFFTIKGLEYKHVLSIDWGVLNEIFGLSPSATLDQTALLLYGWAASNVYEAIAGVVGFIVGLKVA